MVECSFCPEEIDVGERPGAILLSSPDSVENGSAVRKYHLCQDCERRILSENLPDEQ